MNELLFSVPLWQQQQQHQQLRPIVVGYWACGVGVRDEDGDGDEDVDVVSGCPCA